MSPVIFAGGLQQKKKSELQELAVALKLSDQGTRDSLQTRIKEYLDDNQATLEDNPKFAGLYARKRRGAQQHTEKSSSVEDTDAKPVSGKTKDDKITPALEVTSEHSPASGHRDASVPTRKAPLSTPAASPNKSNISDKSPARPFPSLSKQPKGPTERPQTTSLRGVVPSLLSQKELLENGAELLFALRTFLSNSRNIWSLTAVIELLFILNGVIPWKAVNVPLTPKGEFFYLSIFYPPFDIFKTRAFWLVLLHWFLPTLFIPAVVGTLISFAPSSRNAPIHPPSNSVVPFDPLTASIVRLAAEIAYPYTSIETRAEVLGLDILGFRLRVLNASIGLAFAFAEAIAGAPQAFAESFFTEQRKRLTNSEAPFSTPGGRKGVTIDETLVELDK